MGAQWAVYSTQRAGVGEILVQRESDLMPRRQAKREAERMQSEICEPGQLVHTAEVQYYAMNSVSGKILV